MRSFVFLADVEKTVFCEVQLDEEKYQAFVYAVKNHYWYQMYIDDLPIWGMVGEVDDGSDPPSYKIYTHKKFEMGHNGRQIVDVNLTSDGRIKLEEGIKLEFSYEVKWKPSSIVYKDRFDKYLDPNFFQHRVKFLKNLAAVEKGQGELTF